MAQAAIIDGDAGDTPVKKRVRIDLRTPYQIGAEMQRVYKMMKTNAISPDFGSKLIYVLTAISRQQTESDLAKRIEELEKRHA